MIFDVFGVAGTGSEWFGTSPGQHSHVPRQSEPVPTTRKSRKIITQSRPKKDPYKTDYRAILTSRGKVGIKFPGRGHWALPGGAQGLSQRLCTSTQGATGGALPRPREVPPCGPACSAEAAAGI